MMADTDLVARTVGAFRTAYGKAPDVVAFAPGRVNLIGEHTDYNDGFALPCALSFGTAVALARRNDNRIDAQAADLDSPPANFALNGSIARLEEGHWENHLRGIVAGMPRFGLAVSGADLVISGDVPQGAGLSSSASFGVASALGLAALAGGRTPDRLALARVAQWSENEYVGCACGLMDQLTSAFGESGCALQIDCRTFETRPTPFPDGAAIMIVNSGVIRGLVDSAYNQRRQQCATAAEHYGVTALRDLDGDALQANRGSLDEISFRRARHVVTENARTLVTVEAMARGDLVVLGDMMRASHVSLRDDFEVSVPAVDALVDCLNAAIGSDGGARMTGGGFGGCVVAILPNGRTGSVERALARHWQKLGKAPQLAFIAVPSQGAHLVDLSR